MAQLIVEFLSEEIPARMQGRAARDIERLVTAALKQARLDHDGVAAFTTPRRLAFRVDGLPLEQPDIKTERKGPRTDAAQNAIDGFLGSTGLSLDQCETREDKKGAYYVAVIEEKGQPTASVLPGITVGYESILAAGAVAANNIIDCVTAVGIPAQILELPCS